MISMSIVLDGEGAWKDLMGKKLVRGVVISVAALDKGMQSGKPSVAFRVDTEDGEVTFVETSLALFLTAAEAFKARYGDPRAGNYPSGVDPLDQAEEH
jgi:hypothetical protein